MTDSTGLQGGSIHSSVFYGSGTTDGISYRWPSQATHCDQHSVHHALVILGCEHINTKIVCASHRPVPVFGSSVATSSVGLHNTVMTFTSTYTEQNRTEQNRQCVQADKNHKFTKRGNKIHKIWDRVLFKTETTENKIRGGAHIACGVLRGQPTHPHTQTRWTRAAPPGPRGQCRRSHG